MKVEISPRGSGKTYRMVADIVNKLMTNIHAQIIVFVPSIESYDIIKTKVLSIYPDARIQKGTSMEDGGINTFRYFDEFERIGFLDIEEVLDSDYFCTSPIKKRNIKRDDLTHDFLINLIKRNNFIYENHMINALSSMVDKNVLRIASENMPADRFDLEYLGIFIEYN